MRTHSDWRPCSARPATPQTLTEELCRRIAAGEIAADDPALIDHLWATTLDTLAVDQPGYATYRRIIAAEADQT